MRHADFRRLFFSISFSEMGEQMATFAVGWYAILLAQAEGNPALGPLYLGFLGIARAIPGVAFGLAGGVIADRFDRRDVLIGSQALTTAAACGMALAAFGGWLSIGALLALTVIGAGAWSLSLSASSALIVSTTGQEDVTSAIGLWNMSVNVTMFVGPLLGGILIGPMGMGGLMVVRSLVGGASILPCLGMGAAPPEGMRRAGFVESLAEGVAFVVREPVLRWVVALSILASIGGRSVVMLYPAFGHEVLGVGAVELSYLFAARGVGTLTGSFVSASLAGVERKGLAMAIGQVLFGASTLGLAFQRTLGPAIFFTFMCGLAQFFTSGFANVLLQQRAPDRIRARTLSLFTMSYTGFGPLGTLFWGFVASFAGVATAVLGAGALLTAGSAYASAASKALRRPTGRTAAG